MAVHDTALKATPACLGLLLLLATPAATWLEQTMVGHVLVEFPLLIGLGAALGLALAPSRAGLFHRLNAGGIAGIVLVSFSLAFWMIPRWLDASVTNEVVQLAKYVGLVGLVGVPLAWSWPRLHPIARALVKIEFLTMLLRLGWLYLISPDRLCNNYLVDDQVRLGQGFLAIAFSLAVAWLVPLFIQPAGDQSHSRDLPGSA